MNRYEIDDVLFTKEGTRATNAVVIGADADTVVVLSEFGNILKFDVETADMVYRRLRDEQFFEDYPQEPWEERVKCQIKKLQKALGYSIG